VKGPGGRRSKLAHLLLISPRVSSERSESSQLSPIGSVPVKDSASETSLFEAAITHTFWQSAICFATGTSPGPLGSAHPLDAPYQAFETADGWVVIGAANQANWLRFAKTIDRPDLAADPRFRNNVERMRHFDELIAAVTPEMRKRSTQQWVATLDAAGVPVSPVLNVGEMHKDPPSDCAWHDR